MIDNSIIFPAKVILIGEYTVIDGGSALAVPLEQYGGSWKSMSSQTSLLPFFAFLKTISGANISKLEQAIEENWGFESSIPQGSGLGSSGALSAAAYDTFFDNSLAQLVETKNKLAEIESFFHGASSGIDPLISFTKQALSFHGDQVKIVEGFKIPKGFALYDSKTARAGKELISYYQNEKTKAPLNQVLREVQELNEELIKAIISNRVDEFILLLKRLSHLQYAFFKRMIPATISDLWLDGLLNDKYYMKLCGAGGGGYFLVYKVDDSVEIGQEI